ncbi:MAG TPA: hypothetical protein VJ436_10360 [Anaerolineales bacterium]|nr:hypothetical protein [Anaerolineales bacterium]
MSEQKLVGNLYVDPDSGWGLRLKLRPISQALILAETLDIITTYAGLLLFPQLWEANPLAGLLGGMFGATLLKMAITLGVVLVLERVPRWPRLVWIIPAVATLPVMWNLANILVEFLANPVAFHL